MSTRFTVLGASGFIGRHLVGHLRELGLPCEAPPRGSPLEGNLGHVVYCVGLTGDEHRERPFDGVDADVTPLLGLARTARFTSLLYLSSTRVYDRHGGGHAREDDEVRLKPGPGEDLYVHAKVLGEAITLEAGGRVARISNVYGPALQPRTFLTTIIRQALSDRTVLLESTLESVRDYVAVDDVVRTLGLIARGGRHRVYNVASGELVSNAQIAEVLAGITGCAVRVRPGAATVRRAGVDVSRIREEFGIAPARLVDRLAELVAGAA